ncbi:MAG: PEP-CTERM sorting domain-containing protein [Opitutales bacterium]|nr:PEP-CTERM sorting domain-containing protein [Opitutales bacterium]
MDVGTPPLVPSSLGVGGVFAFNTNVADGDLVTGSDKTYILDARAADANPEWTPPDYYRSPSSSLPSDYPRNALYDYYIRIESFAGKVKEPRFFFGCYDRTNSTWLQFGTLGLYGDIYRSDSTTEVGYYTADSGGSVEVTHAQFTKKLRTPSSDPSIPEPSAFGLLAGLGAIVLAASRRRRSR